MMKQYIVYKGRVQELYAIIYAETLKGCHARIQELGGVAADLSLEKVAAECLAYFTVVEGDVPVIGYQMSMSEIDNNVLYRDTVFEVGEDLIEKSTKALKKYADNRVEVVVNYSQIARHELKVRDEEMKK